MLTKMLLWWWVLKTIHWPLSCWSYSTHLQDSLRKVSPLWSAEWFVICSICEFLNPVIFKGCFLSILKFSDTEHPQRLCHLLEYKLVAAFWMKLLGTFYSEKRFELLEKIFSVIKGNNFHSSEEILITPFITRAPPSPFCLSALFSFP